jgi:chromosome partitioning protein
MALVLVVGNLKGGVGKSMSTMMIADGLALFRRQKILIVDMDIQAAVSKMILGTEWREFVGQQGSTIFDFLEAVAAGKNPQLADYIVSRSSDILELQDETHEGTVDIIAAHPAAIKGNLKLESDLRLRYPNVRLDAVIAEAMQRSLVWLRKHYDVIIFDTPAGFGPMSLAPLRLCDVIVAPTILEVNSIDALRSYLMIVLQEDNLLPKKVRQRIHILITKFVRANAVQQLILDQIERQALVLNTLQVLVPYSPAAQRAADRPARGASRLAREKYGAVLDDVKGLAVAISSV